VVTMWTRNGARTSGSAGIEAILKREAPRFATNLALSSTAALLLVGVPVASQEVSTP